MPLTSSFLLLDTCVGTTPSRNYSHEVRGRTGGRVDTVDAVHRRHRDDRITFKFIFCSESVPKPAVVVGIGPEIPWILLHCWWRPIIIS